MNLTKLFKTQAELDKKIIEEKGLQGRDLLDKKILALQVELGELANEWKGFKFWSEDQSPKPPKYNWGVSEDGLNQEWIPEYGYESYPLLEEYVDCLHFILSIGLELRMDEVRDAIKIKQLEFLTSNTVIGCLIGLSYDISDLYYKRNDDDTNPYLYEHIFLEFIKLGKMLGFTWQQIEQAYFEKNKINHERQANGY